MIIANPIIKLDYNPARDVLSVEWPDFREYTVSEAEYILDIIVETVKLYDVKCLLADTRSGVVELAESRYKRIVLRFAKGLAATRLRKVARVVTRGTLRERQVNEVKKEAGLDVPVESFYSTEAALRWLSSK